jgi:hypothetical protein
MCSNQDSNLALDTAVVKDSLTNVATNCPHDLKLSDMSCIAGQCGGDVVTKAGIRFCIEQKVNIVWSSTLGCQAVAKIAKTFDVTNSQWTNTNWVLEKVVDDADATKEYTWTTTNISGKISVDTVNLTFTNTYEFKDHSGTLRFV